MKVRGRYPTLLIRKFMGWYGGYIPSASLRHAIIAFAADSLSSAFDQQRMDNMQKASRELRKHPVAEVDDPQLLTAYILWIQRKADTDEQTVHADEFFDIASILGSSSKDKPAATNTLAPFRHFLLEMPSPTNAYLWIGMGGNWGKAADLFLSTRIPTWNERYQSLLQLHDVQGKLSPYEISYIILRWDLDDIFALVDLSQQGGQFDADQRWSLAWSKYLARWKCDVGSADCQKFLNMLEDAVATNESIAENEPYLLGVCIFCLVVKLLVTILETRFTMSEALRSPQAVSCARALISFVRLHQERVAWVMREKFALKVVFIGGLALPWTTLPDSYS